MSLSSGIFTTIGAQASARSAAQQDSVFFLETSKNGPIGALGIHFNSSNTGLFDDPLGIKVFANPHRIYNSASSRTKTQSTTDFDGSINPLEWVYLLSGLRGRVTATAPTHVGQYVLQITGVGNYQITDGTTPTANIASTATQSAIEASLVATFGRGFCEVVEESAGIFSIELWGEYAVTKTLSLVAAGVATLTPTINPSTLGVYRQAFDLSSVDLGNLQTFRVYQGPFDIAGTAKRYNFVCVSSFGATIGVDDVSMKGKFYAHPGTPGNTIVSSMVTDLPTVIANATEWDYYLGTAKSGPNGPARLCNSTMVMFDISGLIEPYRVIGCGTTSFKDVVVGKANSRVEITLAQDSDSDALLTVAQTGTIFYLVAEWKKGVEIIPGVPYRIVICLPVLVTEFNNGTDGVLSAYKVSGEVSNTGTMKPIIYIDSNIPTIVP